MSANTRRGTMMQTTPSSGTNNDLRVGTMSESDRERADCPWFAPVPTPGEGSGD